MSKKHWTKVYEKTHSPSFVGYKELDFADNPVILKPGQVKGIYIHSTRRGDEAIVYDNKVKQKTHDDSFITIMPGRAHVSEKVFGSIPIWGWGSAWRDNREFVGQIKYGACYRLWNPSENLSFGGNFRQAATTLFMCQRRAESPFSTLPDDCLYYILNMMRWDWVNDTSSGMRAEQKQRRRLRRRQQIAEADAMLDEAQMEDAPVQPLAQAVPLARANDVALDDVLNAVLDSAVLGVDEEAEDEQDVEENHDDENNDDMEEDSSDDSEDADSSDDDSDEEDSDEESADSDAYAWGDHVGSRAFLYNDEDSDTESNDDSGEGEEGDVSERRRRSAMMRARRSILQLLRR